MTEAQHTHTPLGSRVPTMHLWECTYECVRQRPSCRGASAPFLTESLIVTLKFPIFPTLISWKRGFQTSTHESACVENTRVGSDRFCGGEPRSGTRCSTPQTILTPTSLIPRIRNRIYRCFIQIVSIQPQFRGERRYFFQSIDWVENVPEKTRRLL